MRYGTMTLVAGAAFSMWVGCAQTQAAKTEPSNGGLSVVSPANGACVPLLSEAKKAYLALPREVRREKFANVDFRRKMQRDGWKPERVAFAWEGGEPPFRVEVVRADGSDWFRTNLAARAFAIGDFEIATAYSWSVTDGKGAVGRGAFTTEDVAPRILDGGKVPNVRDLGGRVGLDGRRVRQGLIIRSAGLNENACEPRMSEQESLTGPDAAFGKGVNDEIAALTAELRASADAIPESCRSLGKAWKTYRFADTWSERRILGALRDLDGLGREKGAVVVDETADKTGFVRYPELAQGTVFFVQKVTVDEACNLNVRVSGDWFWAMSVNGCIVRNRLEIGNVVGPVTKPDHVVLLRLKAGENVIAAAVTPGSAGLGWTLVPEFDVENEIRELAEARRAVLCRSKGRLRGATRITDANRGFWLDFLGVKTDIDLRSDFECWGMEGSPLGPSVNWAHISSAAYADLQKVFGRDSFAKVFRVFLDRANYPIDFHCIAGQDRTGAVAFILGALLGVEEDELWKDWEATGFWNPYVGFNHKDYFDKLVTGFDRFPGETIRERVEGYVYSLGFTKEDLARFREIMLEPAPAK